MTQVSLLIPARKAGDALRRTTEEAHRFLLARYAGNFEILLIPNPAAGDSADNSVALAEELARDFSAVRSVPHYSPAGKGAALKTGVAAARGEWIFFTDADLPYDLEFFDRAAERLRAGFDLVSGNRRVDTSYFNVPVRLLPIAYGRHRMGITFNRVARLLLPIRTTDTQAGIKAMTRQLAMRSFRIQSCPGFFFDLELFLTARGHGCRQAEMPVTLYLNSEKSTVRLLRESVLAVYWLARISLQELGGYYRGRLSAWAIQRLYGPVPLGTRVFLLLRWCFTPYAQMAAYLPARGKLLDLGAGHGLFGVALATRDPACRVLALDHDSARVQLAQRAASRLGSAALEVREGSVLDPRLPSGERFDGAAIIDVMHYFKPDEQKRIVEQVRDALVPGGVLIVREVDPEGGVISKFNRLYEWIATHVGFTRGNQAGLHFRSRSQWERFFSECGFAARAERCSSRLFADVLYVCRKGPA